MKLKYDQVYNGESFEVPKEWYIACCDCGLVHRLKFKIINKKTLKVRVWREPVHTRARRKALGRKIVKTARKPVKKAVK